MRREPLFSVIVPTYNRPSLLADAIASVLAQDMSSLEIVVVDDGSDPAAVIVADPRARIVRLAVNQGPAVARNAGIEAAHGRYLAFLDDDDLYTPDRLRLAAEGLERAPVATCWTRFQDQGPRSNRILEGDVENEILAGFTPSLGATAVRSEIAPRFDERWHAVEDIEWWLRLARCAPVATVPRIGYLVRRHRGERHRNNAAAKLEENLRLLDVEGTYFAQHPASAAFRWKRIGLLALQLEDRRLGRRALARSMRLAPRPATLKHLLRSIGFPPWRSATPSSWTDA